MVIHPNSLILFNLKNDLQFLHILLSFIIYSFYLFLYVLDITFQKSWKSVFLIFKKKFAFFIKKEEKKKTEILHWHELFIGAGEWPFKVFKRLISLLDTELIIKNMSSFMTQLNKVLKNGPIYFPFLDWEIYHRHSVNRTP